jgi:antirestriction protein ArdC
MAITNKMLIEMKKKELFEAGIIKGTGRVFVFEDSEGNKFTFPETEEIHTYQHWKGLGYQVRKGEKAIAKFQVWKYSTKKVETEDGDEKKKGFCFLKDASFFSESQVDKIEKTA